MAKITTLYKYGLEYKGVLYGWKDKKLYRLPYTSNLRSYQLKEVPFYCFKSTLVCNLQRNKLTLNRLKGMTKEINISLDSIVDDDVPF
jgi:hypothetical protein